MAETAHPSAYRGKRVLVAVHAGSKGAALEAVPNDYMHESLEALVHSRASTPARSAVDA